MDLDNITDVELLRNIVKSYMVQMKQDTNANDGTDYVFKKGYWYFIDQDETGITVYTEDSSHACFLGYDEADRFLIKKSNEKLLSSGMEELIWNLKTKQNY